MQDRVSLYPGRVKLVPVPGQENTYDMVRADNPTQEGTPLNKASLLKDATAALYSLGANAVPDDALRAIKSLINKANADINKRAQIMTGSYVGTSTQENSLTFDFVPKIVFIFSLEDFAILPCLLYGSTEISGSYYYATSSESYHVGSNSIYEAKLVNKTLTLRASSTKPTYWYRYLMNDSEYTYHYIAIG